ncbi:unnamed protein product [Peniophora sp. CBMAI 1063]|nr:unnamed protein product [Peniophora sp. CBMAI 1063]
MQRKPQTSARIAADMSSGSPLPPLPRALDKRDTYYGIFNNVSDDDAALVEAIVDDLLIDGYMVAVMSLLFAFYSVVFFAAMRHLVKDGLRSRPNRSMLAALTFMYGAACVTYAFELLYLRQLAKATIVDFTGRIGLFDSNITTVARVGQFVVQGLSVLCGDLVILWRTAVVWHNSVIIRRVNWIFMIFVVVTWIAGIAILLKSGTQFVLIPLALSLSVNIWSTVAIGYKTWHRRRMVSRHVFMAGRYSGSAAIERALVVLTETGLAYTVLWIVYVAVAASYYFGPRSNSFDEVDLTLEASFNWLRLIMNMLIPIYPTLLILLVARRTTPLTETLTSIDVDAVAVASSSRGSVVDTVPLQDVPDPEDKLDGGFARGPNPPAYIWS